MDPIVFLDLDNVTGNRQMLALDSIEYMRDIPILEDLPGEYRGALTYCRTKTGYEFYTTKSLADIRQIIVEALMNIFTDQGASHA